jgi:hypothetical protein
VSRYDNGHWSAEGQRSYLQKSKPGANYAQSELIEIKGLQVLARPIIVKLAIA